MKAKITRRGVVTLLIIIIIISLAVVYNHYFGRPSYSGMRIQSTFSSSKKKVSKPDIWFEDFWGGKKKNKPGDIGR